eukprot:TRINITY_DN66350_c7_g5_i1.p1 TRINITY_DN66350_c7_g5~~TRINITY_DN66350_c7_g5_i1.p1  ORF type:complete len:436 (+),score=236.07 TRINITY_DN66350_c7_g5_i1:156-1463(+)
MSGRFVRASKYRHVHGQAARKDHAFTNCRPLCSGEGDFIAASEKFFAYAQQGGGGPVIVHPVDKVGRLAHTPPMVNVHKSKVVDIGFSPFNANLLATASEDCYAKITIIPDGGLTENLTEANATLAGHSKKLALLKFHPTANNVLATSAYDHNVKIWDIEAQAEITNVSAHKELTFSLAWSGDGSQMATTCKDKQLRLFDPRAPDAVQATKSFDGGKPSRCVWLTNHNLIAGVGFTKTACRQLKIWDPRNFGEPLATKDMEQASGVVMPFYDPGNDILYLSGKGDGQIKYFEIVPEAPYFHFLSEFRDGTPHKGLTFAPKRCVDVTKCEIARAYRLMRDWVQPVSFIVPRKSDVFQEDIYPDCPSGAPTITAAEYAEGKNGEPQVGPMDPSKASGASQSVAFVAKKSPAELQTELDAANKRIKELEAELAKLKAA